MINKKNIILTALIISLSAGTGIANSSNDLLKMDVKKSSASDTVDVTFYTTGGSTNSVVTRKSDNRYVVLLPNVAGSPSVAPNIGGVKDLITNIDVKNVDDGIGGYTKVTFTTSKPVKIQTAMKKTAPLTKAQEDYKNLIAQNKNTKPAIQPKSTSSSVPKTTNATKQSEKAQSTATAKTTAKQPAKPVETAKKEVKQTTPKAQVNSKPKVAEQAKQVQKVVPPVQTAKNTTDTLKLQTQEKPAQKTVETPKTTVQPQTAPVVSENKLNTIIAKIKEYNLGKYPLWMIILSAIAGLFVLNIISTLFGRKKKSISREQTIPVYNNRIKPEKYGDIMHNKNLNWQEKYSMYNEASETDSEKETNLAYITNTSATKKTIIPEKKKSVYKINKIKTDNNVSLKSIPSIQGGQNSGIINKTEEKQLKLSFKNMLKTPSNKKEEVIKEELRAKISQMEHSLAQTPKLELPSEYKKDIYSEDDSITKKLSDIKLKSFAQPSLNSTHRMLLGAEKRPVEDIKEGRFVKLKNSPLNISTRKSASSKINGSDYYKNHGEMNMDKIDNYNVSSLNEYFSILDSEEKASKYFAKPAEVVGGKVSNPIKANNNAPLINPLKGMIVRSSYNIDSQRGFYIVDMDGVSALIGKINDNIFILKKFNEIIDKNLQVRLDSGSTYIVKAGRYKCLVEVSKDRMGTLIEI